MAEQGQPQRLVAVRRFNAQLCFTCFERMFFKCLYALGTFCSVLRQVTYKCKLLTIQATRRQGQQ